MTETTDLHTLKLLAKRFARANRIAQHQSLNLIAGELGFPNWVKLIAATKKGWMADARQRTIIEALVKAPLPDATFLKGDADAMSHRLAYLQNAEEGMIEGHAYRLRVVLDDVIMAGDGWSLRVPENPSAVSVVETYTEDKSCPVLDPTFLREALKLARAMAIRVRAQISVDWPRRSTKPDQAGVVRHPLSDDESDVWFCLNCEGKITGGQIAQNLWHCPECGGSPLDIFITAFWSDDAGKSFLPVKTKRATDREQMDVRTVDARPKLNLTEEKVVLLVRSALLEEATNVSERLGAIKADITAIDEECLFIALEVDLWPEEKVPVQALEVAAQLGFEVELECSSSPLPFAWPRLGETTSSTSEYTEMMLDAYARYDGLPTDKLKTP